MKKLVLNKKAIAHLNNPDKVFGGEGVAAFVTASCPTCPVYHPKYGRMYCELPTEPAY
jgi:hypothetical protein